MKQEHGSNPMTTMKRQSPMGIDAIRRDLEKSLDRVLSNEPDKIARRKRQSQNIALAAFVVGICCTVLSLLSIDPSTLSAVAFLSFMTAYAVWMSLATGRVAGKIREYFSNDTD